MLIIKKVSVRFQVYHWSLQNLVEFVISVRGFPWFAFSKLILWYFYLLDFISCRKFWNVLWRQLAVKLIIKPKSEDARHHTSDIKEIEISLDWTLNVLDSNSNLSNRWSVIVWQFWGSSLSILNTTDRDDWHPHF